MELLRDNTPKAGEGSEDRRAGPSVWATPKAVGIGATKKTDPMRHLATLALALLIGGCHPAPPSEFDPAALEARLEQGDLLFRRGTGLVGHLVTSMDPEGQFSHVGIVVRKGDQWQIVHAVPHEHDFKGDFDRVKCEPVADFLERYAEVTYGLYRAKAEPHRRQAAAQHALRLASRRVHFDHDYDAEDTTQMYCTELAEYCYALVGVALSEGRRTEVNFPCHSGRYIFPSDLTESTYLTPIY